MLAIAMSILNLVPHGVRSIILNSECFQQSQMHHSCTHMGNIGQLFASGSDRRCLRPGRCRSALLRHVVVADGVDQFGRRRRGGGGQRRARLGRRVGGRLGRRVGGVRSARRAAPVTDATNATIPGKWTVATVDGPCTGATVDARSRHDGSVFGQWVGVEAAGSTVYAAPSSGARSLAASLDGRDAHRSRQGGSVLGQWVGDGAAGSTVEAASSHGDHHCHLASSRNGRSARRSRVAAVAAVGDIPHCRFAASRDGRDAHRRWRRDSVSGQWVGDVPAGSTVDVASSSGRDAHLSRQGGSGAAVSDIHRCRRDPSRDGRDAHHRWRSGSVLGQRVGDGAAGSTVEAASSSGRSGSHLNRQVGDTHLRPQGCHTRRGRFASSGSLIGQRVGYAASEHGPDVGGVATAGTSCQGRLYVVRVCQFPKGSLASQNIIHGFE